MDSKIEKIVRKGKFVKVKLSILHHIVLILLIGTCIFIAVYTSLLSLLYIAPTQQIDIPVKIIDRDSLTSHSYAIKGVGTSGITRTITLQIDNGDIYKASASKKLYDETLFGNTNLIESRLILSKVLNRPVKIKMRSKSLPYKGILKKLINPQEKPYIYYNLIEVPFIGAILSTLLFWWLTLYMIWKLQNKMSHTDWFIHSIGYSMAIIGGFMVAF